ncbi:unnamed protein product [Leuciscus chuanchicus]
MSKEKTAFTTPFGLHQFVTLPFGLFGAPATFQRLMDRILRPHAAYAAAYLDDIIIYSGDWQRHMQHLRAVLKTLRRAGLTANPKKCAVGRVEVRYLGFHLGHGQVRPQIDKTAAVATCPRPKTKKEVRQFLGLAGYYRRFVPNYSDLASPLTDLTKKEVPDTVPWTEQCQQAFTQLKAALCGGPLLHAPDFSLPFILQTDASDRGMGAVLSQEVEGEERPVLYISRKLSKRETMYSTIEKECLAIRWAVLTLRYYLLGREFTLCSDHAPLQWLHRMKDTNARITRWYLALQPFKFQVIHRPGAQMAVADFLSRRRGGEAADRMAPRPESGGGGMWRGGRGFAKSVAGERGRSRAVTHRREMSATGGGQTTTELSPLDNRIACVIGDTALSGITKDGDTDALVTEQTGPSNTQSEATPVVPEELEEPGPSIAPSMRRAPRVLSEAVLQNQEETTKTINDLKDQLSNITNVLIQINKSLKQIASCANTIANKP